MILDDSVHTGKGDSDNPCGEGFPTKQQWTDCTLMLLTRRMSDHWWEHQVRDRQRQQPTATESECAKQAASPTWVWQRQQHKRWLLIQRSCLVRAPVQESGNRLGNSSKKHHVPPEMKKQLSGEGEMEPAKLQLRLSFDAAKSRVAG